MPHTYLEDCLPNNSGCGRGIVREVVGVVVDVVRTTTVIFHAGQVNLAQELREDILGQTVEMGQ